MRWLLGALTLLYAWLCYYRGGRWLALVMLLLWLGRSYCAKRRLERLGAAAMAVFFALIALFAADNSSALYWYPLLINGALLLFFFSSLFAKQSAVERIARLQTPDLPPEGVRYTRRVTQMWCVFFLLNASIIAVLSLLEDKKAWTLYTGVISYLLTGILLGGEWLYRQHKLKR